MENNKQRLFEVMGRLDNSFKPRLNEASKGDRYERVIFLDGEEADEAFEILNNQGKDAALEYLKQWHDYGNHMGSDSLGTGTSDRTYEKDGYIMGWNEPLGYIGLDYEFGEE